MDTRVLRRRGQCERRALGALPGSLVGEASEGELNEPEPTPSLSTSLAGNVSACPSSSSATSYSSSCSAPTASSLVDGADAGVTTRFGVKRMGRDRWHNLNGSLINRGRDGGANGRASQSGTGLERGLAPVPEEGLVDDNELGPASANVAPSSGAPSVSFYGRELLVRVEKADDSEASTTAGEESEQDTPGASSSASSSDSAAYQTGFWKHGQWQARSRTPEELRAHRGGAGPRRAQRRADRVQLYLREEWKPSWLKEYIDAKKLREEAKHVEDGKAKEVEEYGATLEDPAEPLPPHETGIWGDFSEAAAGADDGSAFHMVFLLMVFLFLVF